MKYEILNIESFTEYTQVCEIYGQGCNYATKHGVEGFQIDFDVKVFPTSDSKDDRVFHIVLQSADRSDNMRGYGRFETEYAARYGCDADESAEMNDYLESFGIFLDASSGLLDELDDIAIAAQKEWAWALSVSDKDSLEFKLKNEIASLESREIKANEDIHSL